MEKNNTRISYIDILKAMAIIFVILGHINTFNSNIKGYMYAFHMPLFFICYGLTSKKRDYSKTSLSSILITKFKTLYIPYLIWAIIFSNWNINSFKAILYGSYQTISSETLSSLWFLPCMLIASCIFEIIQFIYNKLKINSKLQIVLSCILTVILLIIAYYIPNLLVKDYPLCLNIAIIALVFIFIGKLVKIVSEKIKLQNWSNFDLTITFVILFILSFSSSLNTSVEYVLMASGRYGNIVLFIFTSVIASLAYYFLAILLDKIIPNIIIKNIITYIGRNTLLIFILQKPIIRITSTILTKTKIPGSISLLIITIIVLTIVCIISLPINRYIPILNGKLKKD